MKQDDQITYAQAFAELEKIVRQIQGNNCDIDSLTALTARAIELLEVCRQRLTTTKEQLDATLARLTQPQ